MFVMIFFHIEILKNMHVSVDISVGVVSVLNSSYSIRRVRLKNEFTNRISEVSIWWQIQIQWPQKHDMTNFICSGPF